MSMKAVIDTSSLLSLVRYYLPNDKNKILYKFVEKKLIDGQLLVLDGVLKESSFVSKKIPLICDALAINTCNIQEYFEKTGEIHIEIRHQE